MSGHAIKIREYATEPHSLGGGGLIVAHNVVKSAGFRNIIFWELHNKYSSRCKTGSGQACGRSGVPPFVLVFGSLWTLGV